MKTRDISNLVFVLWYFSIHVGICLGDLDKTLHHYDTLHHRDIKHHHIGKRSLNSGKSVNDRVVSFDTLGRHFELHLTTNRKLFSPDFVAVSVNGENRDPEPIDLDEDEFYHGFLADEPDSHVQAYYENENLVGKIRTKNDVFVVEPSWRHISESLDYTMITYRASDIKTDKEKNPAHHVSPSFCGYVHEGVDHSNDTRLPLVDELNTGYSFTKDHTYQNRYKRQATNQQLCRVVLVADYHFTQGVGDNNTVTTSKYLAGVLDRVDAIYTSTNFGSGFEGMGFEILSIVVYTSPTNDPEFNKEQSWWETEALLRSFGKEDWSPGTDYCLAHLFTYLAFDGGVQGLGWIASAKTNEIGGICSQVYQNTRYNTAWTSNLNTYGERILSEEADLVTAHEFGHNWGSPHDPSGCAPSGQDGGKYVMYQYSVAGYDVNNDKFSECSRSSIGSVLQVKSGWCFTERGVPICGNSQVEEGEECDAGARGTGGFDSCCSRTCTLYKTAVCSDANSECCQGCQFAANTVQCRQGSTITCDADAFCIGASAECPGDLNRPNGDKCLDRGTCQNGTCLTMCEYNGRTTCTCEGTDTACQYCCTDPNTRVCSPFTEPGESGPATLPNGRSCYAGQCNAGICEPSNIKNTARLWEIIKTLDGNAILEWMRNNIVITVIVLSLIVYLPICLIVWCVERRKAKEDEKAREWHDSNNDRLVRDGETMDIRRTQPRRRTPGSRSGYSPLSEDSEASISRVPVHVTSH